MAGRAMKRAVGLTAAVATVVLAPSAKAGGFAFATFGGEHGHPTTDNATALYFNPGALTQKDGTYLFLDGTLVFRSFSWEHSKHPTDDAPPGYEDANVGTADLFNVLAAPFVGATTKVGDVALGGAFYVPLGGSSQWNQNEKFEDDPVHPGPVDGVQRWYNISGLITSTYLTLGAAYAITDSLSLGLSGNAILTEVEETRARRAAGGNQLDLEGRSFFRVSGWQWSFGAGILWEAMDDRLWFGLSYQGAPNVTGDMTLDGEESNAFPPASVEKPAKSRVSLHQTYPDITRLGGRFRPEPLLELRLFGDFERWSVFREQCLAARGDECETDDDGANVGKSNALQNAKRNWKDTFAVRAGASYWTSEKRSLELFAGAGLDGNAAPDETQDPGLNDGDKVQGSLGARFALGERMHLAASYTHLQFLTLDTRGKSRQTEFEDPTRSPDSGGVYRSWVGFLNVNFEVGF